MKESAEILRSDRGYRSVVRVIILCIKKDFHSGLLKLFEGNFHQGIKLHIIYFSLAGIKHKDCDNFIFNSFAFYTYTCSSDEPLYL